MPIYTYRMENNMRAASAPRLRPQMKRLYTGTYCCALLILLISTFPSFIGSSPVLPASPGWFTKRNSQGVLPGNEKRSLVLGEIDNSHSKERSLALTASALDILDEVQLQVDIKTKIQKFVEEIVRPVELSGTPGQAQMPMITRTEQVVPPLEPQVVSRVFSLQASGKTYTLLVQLTQKATDSGSAITLLKLLAEQCKVQGAAGCSQTWIYVSDGKWELEAWLRASLLSEVKVAPVYVVTAFYNIHDGGMGVLAEDIKRAKDETLKFEIMEKVVEGVKDFKYKTGMYGRRFVKFKNKKWRILVSFKYKGKDEVAKEDLCEKINDVWKYMEIGKSVEFVGFNGELQIFVMVVEEDVMLSGRYHGQPHRIPPLLEIPIAELSFKRYSGIDHYLYATAISSSSFPAQLTPVTSPVGLTATAFDTSRHVQEWMSASIDNFVEEFNREPKDSVGDFLLAADGKTYTLLVQAMPRATTTGGGPASKEDLNTLIAQQGGSQTWMYVRDVKSELEALLMVSRFSQVLEPAVQVATAFYKVGDGGIGKIGWEEEIKQTKRELVERVAAAGGKERLKNGVHLVKEFEKQNVKVLVSLKYTRKEVDITEEEMMNKANEVWEHISIGKSVEIVGFNEEMRIVVMVMQGKANVPEWYFGEHTSTPIILQIGVEQTSLNRYSQASSLFLHPPPHQSQPFPIAVPYPANQYHVSHGKDPVFSIQDGIAYVNKPISDPTSISRTSNSRKNLKKLRSNPIPPSNNVPPPLDGLHSYEYYYVWNPTKNRWETHVQLVVHLPLTQSPPNQKPHK